MSVSKGPKPSESKAAYIVRTLRERILDGTFQEGQSLRQRDIAEQFQVSSTPVREAFSQLQAEGYLIAKRNVGSVVRPLTERMEENWQLRAALESVAAEKATHNATPEDVEHIRSLAKAFENTTDENEAAALNRELHFAIYTLADSPVLMRFLGELWRMLDVSPTSRRSHAVSTAEHWTIVEAIAHGDARSAGEYTRLHINGTAPKR